MTVIQFPVFVKGQTLTDDDLNGLRDSLEEIDRRTGRSIGFGINCGLGGSIAANKLTIDTGIAIDQLGNVLELDAPFSTSLAPIPSADQPPGFIDADSGGFTPVLLLTTTDVPAPQCNEAGCEGHAKQRELKAAISVFPGQLKEAVKDFGEEPLLRNNEPLLVRKTSTVAGGFEGLKNAILGHNGLRLDPDARAKLSSITIAGDLPAIQAYKASFLNEVFFAALDLLRCEFEMNAGCVTVQDGVGVALGWVHQNGTGWSWDCRYRHDWDVPTGVAVALLGGRCEDPCDLYRDQLNALILAFEVPVTPAPPDDPDDGAVDICYEKRTHWVYGQKYIANICDDIVVAPENLDERWRDRFREKVPIPPIPPDKRAELIYRRPETDWAEAGTLSLKDAVGKKTQNVVNEVTNVLTDKGNMSPVQVVTQNQLNKLGGFQPGLTVSAADAVVLVEDALHKVVGVGSIPANTTMRSAVAEVPRVAGLAADAETAAKTALSTTTTFANRLNTVDDTLKGFTTFQTSILSWQSTIDGRMSGLINEIDAKALAAVGKYQLAMQSEIDERIGVAVNTLRVGLVDQVRAEMQVVGSEVRTDVTKDLQAATSTLRKEVEADQKQLTNKVGDLDQHVAALDGQVQVATRDADRSNQRIDTVLTRTRADVGGVGGVGGVRSVVDRELVDVIGNMRTSIVAAATPAQRPKVNAALAESEEAFKAITEATAAGPVELETQRVALGSVLTSMTTAVEAAGAPAADVDRLRGDLGRLIIR